MVAEVLAGGRGSLLVSPEGFMGSLIPLPSSLFVRS